MGVSRSGHPELWKAGIYLPACRKKPEDEWCADGEPECECTRWNNAESCGTRSTQDAAAKAYDGAVSDYGLPKETQARNLDVAGRSHGTIVDLWTGRPSCRATRPSRPALSDGRSGAT